MTLQLIFECYPHRKFHWGASCKQTRNNPKKKPPTASCELLTFTLGREEFGIDILKVQKIRGYESVTTIACAPEFGATLDTRYLQGLVPWTSAC